MNYLNTTAIAVFGFVFAGSMNTANAAEVNVNLYDNVNNPSAHIQIQGTDKTAYNLDNIEGVTLSKTGKSITFRAILKEQIQQLIKHKIQLIPLKMA